MHGPDRLISTRRDMGGTMCSRILLSPRRAFVLAIAVLAIGLAGKAQAQLSEGPHDPAAVVNDACVVGAAWFPLMNAETSDDMYAQTSPAGVPTECLKATDYGFNIPDPAEIKGIEVDIERHTSGGMMHDASVKIVTPHTDARVSLLGLRRGKSYSDAPPVPTMNWRMPRCGSGRPSGSCGANRSYE